MSVAYYKSPIGLLAVTGNDEKITHVQFVDDFLVRPSDHVGLEVAKCIEQLDEYFNFKRTDFDLKVDPEGTEFRKAVWKLLQTIKYGKTISYIDLAKLYGDVNAVRAVGKANSMNPLAIVVPCHRVIGSSGELIGYAGGLEKKRWLLDHEKASLPNGQMRLF